MILRLALILMLSIIPAPLAHATDLDAVEQKLESSRKQQLEQEAQAKAHKKELEAAKKDLIALAAAIQKNEGDIIALEDRIVTLTGEQQQLTVRLEADYGSIGNLILALQRMRRTPPEALIIRPGAPLQTAQTAMLLESVLPAVSRRAEALSGDLQRLAVIKQTLQEDRATVLATKADLTQKRAAMDKLLKDREKLYAAAETGRAAAARDVQRLAAEANDIRDLMARLAEQQA
ncbi:MAG: peptidase M23, partial [Alphaproteobacteria bacterium]|nr:peptidase M23 [Alphaproteobacteria bacterium]